MWTRSQAGTITKPMPLGQGAMARSLDCYAFPAVDSSDAAPNESRAGG